MNSEVRKVRAQELGAPSREVAKSRGARTTVGSRVMGGPLDQEPHRLSHSGVQRLKEVIFDFRSSEVPRAEAREDTWQNHKVGPA
jgi:hypothetical protein